MAEIIAFPRRARGLGGHVTASLQDLALRLRGSWRCEQRRIAPHRMEVVLIPTVVGRAAAAGFRVLCDGAGFVLLDGRDGHLGRYADLRDVALVIADLVGTRAPAVSPRRRA